MKKLIIFVSALILVSMVLPFAVFAEDSADGTSFSVSSADISENSIDVSAVYDDSFAGENEGKLAVTVTNFFDGESIVNIGVSVGLPEGVSVAENQVMCEELAPGESFSRDFVLAFEEIPFFQEFGLWIVIGGIILILLFVFAFIFLKKSKKGSGTVASILAIVILCGACTLPFYAADSSETLVSETLASDDATVDNFEVVTVTHGRRNYDINISVTYDKAVPAESYPLKGDAETDPRADYNTPDVSKEELAEREGPFTSARLFIGDNDFMFMGETLGDYTGWNTYEDRELEKLAEMMNERNAWAVENGIDLYFVICPNKATVYGDYMPDRFEKAETTRCDQVVNYLNENSDISVIDLREPLIAAREEYGDDLYYKYDTHWNQNAGFVAYTEIMKHISEDKPNAVTYSKNDFNITVYETYMKDMAYYLGYYDDYYDEGPVYSLRNGPAATLVDYRKSVPAGQFEFCYAWPDGYRDDLKYFKYESKNEDAPSIYMLRDSFSMMLVPFMKESFSESVYEWTRDFSRSKILESGADTVIIQVVEKNLDEILSSRTFRD